MFKKITSLMLAMLMTLSVPVSGFAKEDESLKSAINIAKSKIEISNKLTEFNYSMDTRDGKNVWNLSWNSKNDNEGGASISIDDNGTIYNYYSSENNQNQPNTIKISKEQALNLSKNFINKVNPSILNKLKLNENNQFNIQDMFYNFSFIRIENTIPVISSNSFYGADNVNISVNRSTGKVQNYSYNWTQNVVFPGVSKVISQKEAEKLFKEKLGLELAYKFKMEKEKIIPYLVYVEKNSNFAIDAFTGEKIEMPNSYPGPMYDGNYAKELAGNQNQNLSPEEIKAIDEVSGIITSQDAEKLAREMKFLELTNEYKLSQVRLFKDYLDKDKMVWNLYFTKETNDKATASGNVSVSINAKNKNVENFYLGFDYDEKAIPKYNKEESQKLVEEFLKTIALDKFENSKLASNLPNIKEVEKPITYTFEYIRQLNGIPFIGNNINITFDAVNGKVTSLSSNWVNVSAQKPDNVVSIDKVYEKLFNEIGLKLQYNIYYDDTTSTTISSTISSKIIPVPAQKGEPKVRVVYNLNKQIPAIFDAISGNILDNNGKIYKANNKLVYTDINNSFAKEQINKLGEFGIGFNEKEFNPNKQITQKEFLYLLSKAYYSYNQDIDLSIPDKMYELLIQNKIMTQKEVSPNSLLAKEVSIKFIVKQLGYDKIAKMSEIFKTDFKDSKKISKDMIGYVAIAKGLKLISGDNGYFNPQQTLTRAEAMVLIYNALNN